MNFDELKTFINDKMSMSHIYQPVLIKALLDSDGVSTTRNIGIEILKHDDSQKDYYDQRVKNMPVPVLIKHNVINKDKNIISLNVDKLSSVEKQELIVLCDKKLNEFKEKRPDIFDHRGQDGPVKNSLRFRVLKNSNFRCELCGATNKDRPLDVDHIIPLSKNGPTEESNLQVLCSKCNRSKGNKDNTDFRKIEFKDKVEDCIFCSKLDIETENDSVIAIKDNFPVTNGHHLVIPKRHTEDYFSMTESEKEDAADLLRVLKKKLEEEDETITGFNIGMNSGESAGQTVMHAHIHLIPRRKGDTPNPRGGVRGVIPEKMSY